MKKLYYTHKKELLFAILFAVQLVVQQFVQAQLAPGGIYSVGPNPVYTQPGGGAYTGNFTTLTAAVTQLNLSGTGGSYILELQNDYTSGPETFPITITYSGTVTATATIRPRTDVPLVGVNIQGNVPNGNILNLNSADFVKIDGRPGATGATNIRRLYIQNAAASTTPFTNTSIQFTGGSKDNEVKSCLLRTNGGRVIFLGIGGNSNNNIEANVLDFQALSLPTYGILSNGTTGNSNANNIIKENVLVNISQRGISAATNSTGWQILGNWITGGVTFNTASQIQFIPISVLSGNSYEIRDNVIGDDGSGGNVTYQNINPTGRYNFMGIYTSTTTSGLNTISGNVITHLNVNSSCNFVGNTHFAGIFSFTGLNQIGGPALADGNVIGDVTGATDAIQIGVVGTAANTYIASGIRCLNAQSIISSIQNNGVGGFQLANLNQQPLLFNGILVESTASIASPPLIIKGNVIGSSAVTNSISLPASSTGSGNRVLNGIDYRNDAAVTIDGNYVGGITSNTLASDPANTSAIQGIILNGAGTGLSHQVINNLVENLITEGGSGFYDVPATCGIRNLKSDGNEDISNNIVRNLTTNGNARICTGIMAGNGPAIVHKINANRIYNIKANTDGGAAGLFVYDGINTLSNNQISITNSPNTTNTSLYGIWDDAAIAVNTYYNSVYIGGSQIPTATYSSIGYFRTQTTTVDIKNNIFYMERTGGTGPHVNIANSVASPSTGWGVGASDRNLFVNSTTDVGYWNPTTNTFAGWQTASSCDANSIFSTALALPASSLFANTTTGDLKTLRCVPAYNAGVANSVLTDYYNINRATGTSPRPTIGSTEMFAVTPAITIASSPLVVCAGGAVTFTATPTNGGLSPNYDFRKNGTTIQSGTSNVLLNPALIAGDVIDCVLTSSNDCASPTTATSNSITAINCVSVTYTWNGTTSNDWFTATNWTPNGVPNNCGLHDVVINSTFGLNWPVLNSPASIRNLTMNAGVPSSLTLNSTLSVCGNIVGGSTVFPIVGAFPTGLLNMSGPIQQTISGRINIYRSRINNTAGVVLQPNSFFDVFHQLDLEAGQLNVTSGTLTLKSSATNHAAVLNNFTTGMAGTLLGNITAERYFSGPGDDQHQMGMPVSGNLGNLGANTASGYFIPTPTCSEIQQGAGSPYGRVFRWDETNPINAPQCILKGWEAMPASAVSETGRGYSVYLNFAGTNPISVTGVPNINPPYTSALLGNTNYNLPTQQSSPNYTFESGWHLLANPFPSSLVYTAQPGFGAQAFVYLPSGPFVGTYQPLAPGDVLAPFQGFMVFKTPGGTASYSFLKSNQSTSNSSNFSQNNNAETLHLEITGNGYKDATRVAFNHHSTELFDVEFDLRKQRSNLGQPTLFSGNHEFPYAINTLNNLSSTSQVQLGVIPGNSGSFTITVNGVNSFDPTSYIYLEDKVTGIYQNLRSNNSYTFSMSETESVDRFVLHFTPKAEWNVVAASCNSKGLLTVEQSGTNSWQFSITDQQSTSIAAGLLSSNSPISVNVDPGVYTVNLTDVNGYQVSKQTQVGGTAPFAAIITASKQTAETGETIDFSCSNRNAANITWNLGDGTILTSAPLDISYSYTNEGTYNIYLTAESIDGCVSTFTKPITVTASLINGVDNRTSAMPGIKVYPNPVIDELVIEVSTLSEETDLQLTNILGEEILTKRDLIAGTLRIKAEGLSGGVYIIKLKSDTSIITQTFVKQ